MSRGAVRVRFVGAQDVVEHIVSKAAKTRRKSYPMQMVLEGEGLEVVAEEDYLLHRMSKELIENDSKEEGSMTFVDSLTFNTPIKSSQHSIAGRLDTSSRHGLKVNFGEGCHDNDRNTDVNFTPRSILKRRSVAGDQHPPSITSDSSVHRKTRRSLMTPSNPPSVPESLFKPAQTIRKSSSTPSKSSSTVKSLSTPSKSLSSVKSSSTPSKSLSSVKSSSTPSKSLSTPSKSSSVKSSSRTPSKSSSRTPSTTTPSKPPPKTPRKTPLRLRKRNDVDESSSSESDIDDDDDDDDDDESLKNAGRRRRHHFADDDDDDDNEDESQPRRHVTEDYFEKHHKTARPSTTTSNHTLRSKLEAHEVTSLLGTGKEGKGRWRWLTEYHTQSFSLFYYLLMQGYNILFHGLGSKVKLIEKFQRKFLRDYNCLVINGFFPGLTFKNITSGFLEILGEENSLPSSGVEQVRLVREACAREGYPDIFLLINNIDGFNLRNDRHQLSFSLLATIPGIHVVASVDHINSALLWDQSKLQRLNWLWFEVTTYESYANETAHENCLLVEPSGVLQLSSLSHVMRSLTSNAKGIFMLLCRHQLLNANDPVYQGLPFSDLYLRCREGFLVNSEPTLRSQLVEFKDHALIRTKKGLDGVENVLVLIDKATLITFIEEQG